LASIKFSGGEQEKLELEVAEDPSDAVKVASGWLNDGVRFEEAIAAASALSANCRWSAVCKLQKNTNKVNILALYDSGRFVDCFSYNFNKTPCEEVLTEDKFCHYTEVQHTFPEDKDLVDMGVAD